MLWFLLCVVSVQGLYEKINVKHDWWETALIYKIYPRSFLDSDGDGIGDIAGIMSKMDYFKDLGVNAIWLAPIYKSPMHDFGFDVSDFYGIHPEYGTMEEFELLLKKAEDSNIKVIIDFVMNHASNESEWFLKSMSRDEYYNDWFIWENGYLESSGRRAPPNNWVSVFRKSAWTYCPNRDQFYYHQYGNSQPDLNYRNPVVFEEMKNVVKFWLEKGVAGMMVNSANHLVEVDKELYGGRYPHEPLTGTPGLTPDDYGFLKHIYTKDLDETYEVVSQLREVFDSLTVRDNMTRVMMTEAHTSIKKAVRYYGHGTHRGAQIPLNTFLIDLLDKDSDARDIKHAVDMWMTYKPLKKHANWMLGSQDTGRIATRFRPELVDAFNIMILLLPGIAMTFMGEEIGMINGFVPWIDTKDPLACNTDDPINYVKVSRDPVRTPFQWSNARHGGFSTGDRSWLPVASGSESLNVDLQKAAIRSHYQVYVTVASLRTRPAFRQGRFDSLALNSDVFAFKRWFHDDTYVVVINFGKSFRVVNLTAFDLVFGQLEVEAASILSSRSKNDNVQANYLDLAADEALVLRMRRNENLVKRKSPRTILRIQPKYGYLSVVSRWLPFATMMKIRRIGLPFNTWTNEIKQLGREVWPRKSKDKEVWASLVP